MQGIKLLQNSTSTFLVSFKKNLEAGKCVACGKVDLKFCDKVLGMCPECNETSNTSQEEFDQTWFSVNSNK